MTSKEILERIHESLLRYDENYDYHDVETIKQDLELLEVLKKENATLKIKVKSLEKMISKTSAN